MTSSSSASASPTLPYTVISARSGSPIHLLPLNAAGLNFYLGGLPASYCPLTDTSLCPPGDATAFLGSGALDTEVPGGQIIFVAPDGHLGFSQAHSGDYPLGSVLDPFNYSRSPGTQFGSVNTTAFGATGMMACPQTTNGTSSLWQVFASLADATVPTGNTSDCLGFDALTSDYTENATAAAWEYT